MDGCTDENQRPPGAHVVGSPVVAEIDRQLAGFEVEKSIDEAFEAATEAGT